MKYTKAIRRAKAITKSAPHLELFVVEYNPDSFAVMEERELDLEGVTDREIRGRVVEGELLPY